MVGVREELLDSEIVASSAEGWETLRMVGVGVRPQALKNLSSKTSRMRRARQTTPWVFCRASRYPAALTTGSSGSNGDPIARS
jgi:hypothetical protein